MYSGNQKNKRKTRRLLKSRHRKQKGGTILPEDIMFQDDNVCILKPDVKKGILVFTNYKQSPGIASLCELGLKTGSQLQKNGVNFGRSMIHDYIFFRAPYLSEPIDYTSIDTEISSSFGKENLEIPSRVWIRVDPEKTYVYSSEIRAVYSPQFRYGTYEYLSALEREVRKSRKSMVDYLRILVENERVMRDIEPGKKILYNLLTSTAEIVDDYDIRAKEGRTMERQREYRSNSRGYSLLNPHNININSEVLVKVPHLTPNYFVKCS